MVYTRGILVLREHINYDEEVGYDHYGGEAY